MDPEGSAPRDPPPAGSGGSSGGCKGPDTHQVEAQRRIFGPVLEPEEVTFEDVAISFSSEEWSTLQGWQKELHKEVMLENYTLLLSLGRSVPSAEFSYLISQLEGTNEDQKPGWAVREDNCRGDRPSFPEDLEQPWDLEGMNHKEDWCLTPSSDVDGEHQSSLHLCALMKLVKEIPEFLYGHTKAHQDPIAASDDDGSDTEGASDAARGHVADQKESPHHLSQWGNLAGVPLSPHSHPGTPASSTEDEWAEPQIQDVATNTEVVREANPAHSLLKHVREGLLNRPSQSGVQNGSPQTGVETELCAESAAVKADTTLEGSLIHEEDGTRYGEQEEGAEGQSRTPQDPTLDSLDNGASRDPEPSRTKAGVGEEYPPKAETLENSGHQLLPNSQKKGETDHPPPPSPLCSVAVSRSPSLGDWKEPETVTMRPEKEDASKHTSLNMAPGKKTEDKPLRGLLKCLKELIVHQPHPPQQASHKPSPGSCQETHGQRRREVGRDRSPSIRVKIESVEEELLAHSPEREGAGPPLIPRGNLSVSQTDGSRRMNALKVKEGTLLARVKVKRETNSPPLRYPDGSSSSINAPRATSQERRAEETSALGVKIKLEPGEDPHFSGLKGPPEEEEEEERYLHPFLPNSGSFHSSAEARMDLGPWVPYPEEWSPSTSPLHGLLKCLKEIPVPRPPASEMLPGKRGVAVPAGGGGKERRRGGRRGRLELRSEWATAEKTAHGPTSPAVTVCGPGNPLQGLERCLKELSPNAPPSQPCSPAISSSISSSPDRLLRWMPERGKWTRKEDGLGQNSAPLQGLERSLKELPLRPNGQSSSPAVSNSFSSSSDGLHRWTPEAGKWSRKEEGISRNSTPFQGLEHGLKKLPQTTATSQPCSPAVSSSLSSSPDRLHRWTPEPGRWTRKEEGLSHNSTPLQGLENFLKELPGTTGSQAFLPAINSTVGSSSDRRHKPGSEEGSAKKGGATPSGIPPLQGLENCLKEIPVSGHLIPNSDTAAHNLCIQKLSRTEMASRKPWKGDGASGSLPQCSTGCLSGSVHPEAGAESSPLHRLMNCLKEIPIRRPSYLNTPSVSSSSSSCSEMERDQQSPGSGPWWDYTQDGYQGSEVEEVARQKEMDSRRMGRSPLMGLPSEEEALEERRLPATRVPSASPPHGLENCLKDLAVSQLLSSNVPSAKAAGTWWNGVRKGSESGNVGLCPATGGGNSCDPESCSKDTAATAAAASILSCSSTPTQESFGERDAEFSNRDAQVQHPHAQVESRGAATPARESSKPLSSNATPDNSAQREWDRERNPSSGEREVATESSPLQGLIRCLKEITARGPSPGCRSANRLMAKNVRGESRHEQVEGEEEEEEEEEFSARRASLKDANPTGTPVCGRGNCPKGNEHPRVMSLSSPVLKPCVPKWSGSNSSKSGEKRALMAAKEDDSPALLAASCRFESQDEAESGNPLKKRCPGLDSSSPLCNWGNGKPQEGQGEIGDLGPVLSKKLDRLSADMSAICRDVSQLQSHMDRLEQDARGWVLELATLRMENRSLCEYIRQMEGRCRTLENRSRRNNLRILGLPEGAEGNDAVAFLQRTLPAMLGLLPEGLPLEIESARRVHGGTSWDPSGRPRPLVFRLLRFADKTAILQAARARPLSYASVQITILPDFCSSLSQRRRVPFGTFRRARWVADLCFGSRHPSCCYPWTQQGLRQPTLGNSGPLAGERESRVSKRTGTGNWDTGPLAGPGGNPSGSCEQHNP